MLFSVLDIETVPDLKLWQPPADKPDEFPPPAACRVVAWSQLNIKLNRPSELYTPVLFHGASSNDESDCTERQIIEAWSDLAVEEIPTFVTWNGRGFDLPVLMMRALYHGLPMPWYYSKEGANMRYRYSDTGHLDLMDYLADFGSSRKCKLDLMAKLCGLPGKEGEVHGSNITEQLKEGRSAEILHYCKSDVIQTALIFLKTRFHLGKITFEEFEKSAESFKIFNHDKCDLKLKTYSNIDWDRYLFKGEKEKEMIGNEV